MRTADPLVLVHVGQHADALQGLAKPHLVRQNAFWCSFDGLLVRSFVRSLFVGLFVRLLFCVFDRLFACFLLCGSPCCAFHFVDPHIIP